MLLIDKLIASEGYASHWFHFWADLLKVDSTAVDQVAAVYYADWVKKALASNMPYDQMVYELITATGMPYQNGATGWMASDQNMKPDHMANTVQAFLGIQIQCAQCHDHPFDKWTQMDFFKMAAFTYGFDHRGGNANRGNIHTALREEEEEAYLKTIGIEKFPKLKNEEEVDKIKGKNWLNFFKNSFRSV